MCIRDRNSTTGYCYNDNNSKHICKAPWDCHFRGAEQRCDVCCLFCFSVLQSIVQSCTISCIQTTVNGEVFIHLTKARSCSIDKTKDVHNLRRRKILYVFCRNFSFFYRNSKNFVPWNYKQQDVLSSLDLRQWKSSSSSSFDSLKDIQNT